MKDDLPDELIAAIAAGKDVLLSDARSLESNEKSKGTDEVGRILRMAITRLRFQADGLAGWLERRKESQ